MMSTSAYHAMRTSGCLELPSERTLRDYTHFFQQKEGFQTELNDMLFREARLDKSSEDHSLGRNVIVFDEISEHTRIPCLQEARPESSKICERRRRKGADSIDKSHCFSLRKLRASLRFRRGTDKPDRS